MALPMGDTAVQQVQHLSPSRPTKCLEKPWLALLQTPALHRKGSSSAHGTHLIQPTHSVSAASGYCM